MTGWALAKLSVTPVNDGVYSLTATATEQDASGKTSSASATETVTAAPMAPTVSWSSATASGAEGSAIALGTLSDTVNGLAGDSNTLSSLVLSGIPVGDKITDGTNTFTATTGNTSVSVAGWALSKLSVTPAATGSFTLTATATEQGAAGTTSSAAANNTVTAGAAVTTGYADGSSGAPAGTPQLPSILSGYAVRPPWEVAGVNYAVGIPTGTALLNPATISMAGVSVNTTNHTVTVTGNNVTLNGYDFSLANGYEVIVEGANDTIKNCNFVVGSN